MATNHISTISSENQLLSKQALALPPNERLILLLNAKIYPIVKKRTSAEAQIKEMIDFYNLCCFMISEYFPDEQSENNFALLNFIYSQEGSHLPISDKLSNAFRLLQSYEELENKITAIQMLFYQYQEAFPDIYQSYNLDDFVMQPIFDIIEHYKYLRSGNPSFIEQLMKRWELV